VLGEWRRGRDIEGGRDRSVCTEECDLVV
jgi:hypothetical protein